MKHPHHKQAAGSSVGATETGGGSDLGSSRRPLFLSIVVDVREHVLNVPDLTVYDKEIDFDVLVDRIGEQEFGVVGDVGVLPTVAGVVENRDHTGAGTSRRTGRVIRSVMRCPPCQIPSSRAKSPRSSRTGTTRCSRTAGTIPIRATSSPTAGGGQGTVDVRR